MKFQSTLSASLLAITLTCLAEEPNPFINQEPKKATPEASGDSFVNLTEHILVPADQLDAWLEKHPLNEDATDLRTQVQIWIEEGSAQLDQTALSTGTAGREFLNASGWEQIYATEYEPAKPGQWPMPSAFETRNLGYDVTGSAGIEHGAMLLQARMEYCGMMLPSYAWNELARKTRQPEDMFMPRFRVIRAERAHHYVDENQTAPDPFAENSTTTEPKGARELRFAPEKIYLVTRAPNELPDPVINSQLGVSALPTPQAPDHLVRLIFVRGTVLESSRDSATKNTDIHHLSAKLVRVDHHIFSQWIQTNELSKTPDLAWTAVNEWQKNGTAKTTSNLIAPYQAGDTCNIQDIVEVIYPTEWEPGKYPPTTGDKPSQLESSMGTAFETRNVGTMLGANIASDPKGAIVRLSLERVQEGGKTVLHRIPRDGEWIEDMTFPVFSSNRWKSELRVKRGEWMLVGSGSDIDEKGRLDPNHSVLAFIKLD